MFIQEDSQQLSTDQEDGFEYICHILPQEPVVIEDEVSCSTDYSNVACDDDSGYDDSGRMRDN